MLSKSEWTYSFVFRKVSFTKNHSTTFKVIFWSNDCRYHWRMPSKTDTSSLPKHSDSVRNSKRTNRKSWMNTWTHLHMHAAKTNTYSTSLAFSSLWNVILFESLCSNIVQAAQMFEVCFYLALVQYLCKGTKKQNCKATVCKWRERKKVTWSRLAPQSELNLDSRREEKTY